MLVLGSHPRVARAVPAHTPPGLPHRPCQGPLSPAGARTCRLRTLRTPLATSGATCRTCRTASSASGRTGPQHCPCGPGNVDGKGAHGGCKGAHTEGVRGRTRRV
eukprot:20301-Prorocentrum_minimum.AAC.2